MYFFCLFSQFSHTYTFYTTKFIYFCLDSKIHYNFFDRFTLCLPLDDSHLYFSSCSLLFFLFIIYIATINLQCKKKFYWWFPFRWNLRWFYKFYFLQFVGVHILFNVSLCHQFTDLGPDHFSFHVFHFWLFLSIKRKTFILPLFVFPGLPFYRTAPPLSVCILYLFACFLFDWC